ncbi:MAG TPA: hypothetical protein DDZ51_05435 [Planctomycetaceae bacterium]|nr:hypothetical protein [Planctomycetaceae bacterium]
MIVGGVVAALPFRRSSSESDTLQPLAAPPSTDPVDTLTIAKGGWGESPAFDPSLAWQPLPMAVPGHHTPALPPMPDSYYDVSFEIQQPQPVRDRFPAAAGASLPTRVQEAGGAITDFSQPDRWVTNRQPVPEASGPLPEKIAVEDLITDRFVYTPLAKQESTPPSQNATNGAYTPAHSASMTRSISSGTSDSSRPKYFIREPD